MTKTTNWELNCLDANNQVLENVNVKVFAGGSGATEVTITLPTIASLNNRNVTVNIDSNDYGNSIAVTPAVDNFVNGTNGLKIAYPKFSVTPVVACSSNNWSMPVIQEAP